MGAQLFSNGFFFSMKKKSLNQKLKKTAEPFFLIKKYGLEMKSIHFKKPNLRFEFFLTNPIKQAQRLKPINKSFCPNQNLEKKWFYMGHREPGQQLKTITE